MPFVFVVYITLHEQEGVNKKQLLFTLKNIPMGRLAKPTYQISVDKRRRIWMGGCRKMGLKRGWEICF